MIYVIESIVTLLVFALAIQFAAIRVLVSENKKLKSEKQLLEDHIERIKWPIRYS